MKPNKKLSDMRMKINERARKKEERMFVVAQERERERA